MKRRILQAWTSTIVGAAAMVGGLLCFVSSMWISPNKLAMVFGSSLHNLLIATFPFIILPGVPGCAALALGAYLARTRSRSLVYWAFALMAFGLAPIILAVLTGILLWPGHYFLAIGWAMGIVSLALTIADLLKGRWGESDEELRERNTLRDDPKRPLVPVHKCASYSEAEVVISCLGANGIQACANSRIPDSALPVTLDELRKIQVLVKEEDVDAAYSILNTHTDVADVDTEGELES